MHWQLTDTTRRRAERTIRTIVNDGPNTSAPIETIDADRHLVFYSGLRSSTSLELGLDGAALCT